MEKKDDNNPEMVKIYNDSRRCKYWFLICLVLAVLISIFIIIFMIWAIFSQTVFKYYNIIYLSEFIIKKHEFLDWGLGIGIWGLDFGDWN